MALVDYFLKIDGISGESPDAKHKGEIDLEAFSWGATNVGAQPGGPGRAPGKVTLQDLHFTTKVNKASPMLFLACATGKHIKQAILTARKAGKSQQEFLIIKMTDVLISSYQASGSEAGDEPPMDQVSFNFGRLDYEYRPEKPDGSLAPPVKAGWDVKKNQPV